MKRSLIQTLLKNRHAEDLRERIAEAIPPTADRSANTAAAILADAIEVSQKHDLLDPSALYFTVCSSSAAQLAEFLQGTPSGDISRRSMAAAQVILNDALTSKAGRKKTSTLSRQEQVAAAQMRRREKVKQEARHRLDVWISPDAAENLQTIQSTHAFESQAETIEQLLAAAIKGELLKAPNE